MVVVFVLGKGCERSHLEAIQKHLNNTVEPQTTFDDRQLLLVGWLRRRYVS